MFMFEWRNCDKEVILDATCVICTDSTSGSELLLWDVGRRNLKGIIIIQDKAGMETKARTWVPIVKLKEASQMVGIVRVGDCNQLKPLPISKGAQINEFALQISHSLYDQLFLHKFPFTQLLVQYCMHPDICNLVNKRIYNNRLQNDDYIADQMRNGDWDTFLIS